jgi:hypothetical protein
MWRIKMLFKFTTWLLKKIFKVPLLAVAQIHCFLDYWKEQCRYDWGMATLMFVLTSALCMVSGLFGVLIFVPEADVTRQMLGETVIHGFFVSVGTLVFVMLLASYDSFIEEYEETFNKLKE